MTSSALFLALVSIAGQLEAQSRPATWNEVFFRSGQTPDLNQMSFERCDDGTRQAGALWALPAENVPIGSRFAETPSADLNLPLVGMPIDDTQHNVRVSGIYCRGDHEVVVLVENTSGQGILLDRAAVDETGILHIRTERFSLLRPAHLEQTPAGEWKLVAAAELPSDRRILNGGTEVLFSIRGTSLQWPGTVSEVIRDGPSGPVICPVIRSLNETDRPLRSLRSLQTLRIRLEDGWLPVDIEELLDTLDPSCRF